MEREELLQKYMHISVDDINNILKELTEGTYDSIYEHEILKFFKKLHDAYGTVFSLYCFYENKETPTWSLKEVTDKFKHEFIEAASWLKFGFHGRNINLRYNETVDSNEALEDYNNFVNAVEHFADSCSIDVIPRIHFFAGTIEQAKKWRDAYKGAKGFLAADDIREVNSYLNADERGILEKHSFYFEPKERLYFFKTNLRLEKVEDPYKTLEDLKQNPLYVDQKNIKIIFTHERYLYDDAMLDKVEACCKWARDNNLSFTYPMEFLKNI
jgi:hypothetical protein